VVSLALQLVVVESQYWLEPAQFVRPASQEPAPLHAEKFSTVIWVLQEAPVPQLTPDG
jgi:hypothetical protein